MSANDQEILRARAKKLARRKTGEGAARESIDVVEFMLASEIYAVESTFVREVYSLRELTPLPGAPPFLLGMTNVRGQIVSVVDLKIFFDLPSKNGLSDLNKLVLLRQGEMEMGILADVVLGARSIAVDGLQPSLATLTGARAEYLRGITKGRVIVLDAFKIMNDKRIVVEDRE